MTILSKLNLSDKTKAAMLTAPENRVRAKILDAIETQIAAAEADAAGEPYTKLTSRYTTNEETGTASSSLRPNSSAPMMTRMHCLS